MNSARRAFNAFLVIQACALAIVVLALADVRQFESAFPEAMIVVRGKNASPSGANGD